MSSRIIFYKECMKTLVGFLVVGAWSCKSSFWLHLYETAAHRGNIRTHTRVGRRKLAREWRVKRNWEMKEPKEPERLGTVVSVYNQSRKKAS